MLCELHALGGSLVTTWALLSVLGVLAVALFSGSVFLAYYVRPTFEQWQRKINPAFPPAEAVRDEVLQTLKGLLTATVCPALSLYLAAHGRSKAYCGVSAEHGLAAQFAAFLAIWVVSDCYEWGYHYLGHRFAVLWDQHRSHHVFYNPSPFAVIADDMFDQFVRSAPLLLFPLALPVNIDVLFFTFTLLFYGYGTTLHWGFESTYLSAHNSIVNGSYEHYYHHAKATLRTGPIYTGFFFKIWDSLAGSVPPAGTPCICSRCEVARGKRTRAAWEALPKPDYSPLLAPSFWLAAFSGAPAGGSKRVD